MFNILSIDVEEWFHPEALQHLFPSEKWNEQDTRVEENVVKLIDLFDRRSAKATFFILGWVAKKYPHLVKRMLASGHEVATHGNSHRMVTKLTPDEFRTDLQTSIDIIQEIGGQPVLGFRAPTFSIVKETQWAWEIMLEEGLRYDSSVYPIWHDRYGIPDAPRRPYFACQNETNQLIEFPMPTLQIGKKNIPFGGGGYLRIFPLAFTRFAIRRFNGEGLPAIVYAHPWEFDTLQPKLVLGSVQTWRHYYNISSNMSKLDKLLQAGQWIAFRDVIDDAAELKKIMENS